MTTILASAASKSSNCRALAPMRRVLPSDLPSGSKAGLPLNVAQPHSAQKWWATCLVCQR
jgi:hypothetical protein